MEPLKVHAYIKFKVCIYGQGTKQIMGQLKLVKVLLSKFQKAIPTNG